MLGRRNPLKVLDQGNDMFIPGSLGLIPMC